MEEMKDRIKELQMAVKPLIEYMRKYETPMTTAIVTGAGAEIVSTKTIFLLKKIGVSEYELHHVPSSIYERTILLRMHLRIVKIILHCNWDNDKHIHYENELQ